MAIMAYFIISIILCGSLSSGLASDLGPWDEGLRPYAPRTLSFRQSRARIIIDDAACLEEIDLNPVRTCEEAIVEEAHDTISHQDQEPQTTSTSQHQRGLKLALSFPQTFDTDNILPRDFSFQRKTLRSTGTTIVGCLVEHGRFVILGADTRATDDRMVSDKRCEKIHRISPNVYCCGAGTSADLDALTRLAQYSLALDALETCSIGNDSFPNHPSLEQQHGGILLLPIHVPAACRFLRNVLYEHAGRGSSSSSLGVNLILGGYNVNSQVGQLTAIHPHGSMDVVPFAALGSGGLAAMAVLESRYHPELTREQGMELVKSAVLAGIENDLASGSQVDICVLGPEGAVEYTRAIVPEQQLIANDNEDQKEDFTFEEKTTSNGVNGFGNLPFAVNSRRVVASQHDESERLKKWDDLLGFNK